MIPRHLETLFWDIRVADFDPKLYPEYNDALRSAMTSEARSFVQSVVFDGDGRLGSLLGAALLLALPESVFHRVVPALVLLAVLLVVVQPCLSAALAAYRDHAASWWAIRIGVALTAVYGGYFGAAMGVLLIGVLSVFLKDDLQRINALKNVMAAVINAVAAVVFVVFAHVAWVAAALIAVSSIAGGLLGAAVGRRLHPNLLRALIVIGGLAAFVKLLAS